MPYRTLSAKTLIVWQLVVTAFLTCIGTQFQAPETILSVHSWGAGTPSGTQITAFATAGPWWRPHKPDPIMVTPIKGLAPVVAIPRDQIHVQTCSKCLVPPRRGIGYEAFLGMITTLRSLGSRTLIYDFALVVRIQQVLLVLAMTLLPLSFYLAHPSFRSPTTFVFFNVAYALVLLARPNRAEFLTEGIIDNALANPCALFSLIAFFVLFQGWKLQSRREVVQVVPASLGLSFCSLVRGEFLVVHGFVLGFFAVLAVVRDRSVFRGCIVSVVLLFSFPVAHGTVNALIFGHFVPLRLTYGQNLYEPIGQFPNPWGIQYDDQWLDEYVESQGIRRGSFEADQFLVQRYVDCLQERPEVFVSHFLQRLSLFSKFFSPLLQAGFLPILLIGAGYASWKDERWFFLACPLVFATGYLLFFGWTNSLLRCVTPVHFLLNLFFIFGGLLTLQTLFSSSNSDLYLKWIRLKGIWLQLAK